MYALLPSLSSSLARLRVRTALLAVVALSALPAHSALSLNAGNGTVTDTVTSLVWDQCPFGLSGAICATGTELQGTWVDALAAAVAANTASYKGYNDWRVPNKKELESIVKRDAYSPAIDFAAFPGTPSSNFWTSTTHAPNPGNAGSVHFESGFTIDISKTGSGIVRLVRSGQQLAFIDALPAVTPTAARLDIPQNFTITGINLTSGMGFTIEDCDGTLEVGTGTVYQRTYQCTPRLPGPKLLTFKKAPGGDTLFTTTINIDHPARLGSAGARGIPSVNGVSLWNGNVHLEATDLAVPGRGVSFALTRSYNSYSWAYEDSRGAVSNAAPWRFNWDIKLGYVLNTGNKQIWVEREDGSGENFFKDADTFWYPMDQGNFNQIKGDTPTTGQTTLLTREGLQYVFYNPDYAVDPAKKGLLIGIYDHDGNGLTVQRDGSNRVGTVTDATGRVYTFAYGNNGKLASVTDFSGRHVDYTWESSTTPASVRLKTVTDVRLGVTTYSYTLKTSALTQNKPTDQILLTSIIDPNGNAGPAYTARTFTYSDTVYGNWGAASVTDAENNTWGFNYCAKQPNASCAIDPVGAQSFETYTTPPLGGPTVARFDTGGRLVEQVNANTNTSKTTPLPTVGLTSKSYNLAALATKRQSALGVSGSFGTDYAYTPDNAGNLLTQTDAESATTTRTWSEGAAAALVAKNLHRATTFANAMGAQTLSTFTAASGSPLTHKPPGLTATLLGYDGAGQVTSIRDARLLTTTQAYDADGNLTHVTGPDSRYVQNSYDDKGRVLTTRDKRGFITTNTWDAAGNLTSVKDPLNGMVSYVYDANGNRSQMTDANGNITNYGYDFNNRLKTVSKANGAQTLVTTTTYDALGRVTATQNANLHTSTNSLDGVGNVLSRADALGESNTYVYDADNRVTYSIVPQLRTTATTYDKVGRVKTVTTPDIAGNQLTTSYSYDPNGRMTSSTDAGGKTTQYQFDPAGRLITVTDANNQLTVATYDDNGNMLTVKDPANHTTTYTYDALNRPLTRVDANGQQWSTTYDENGNALTQTVPSATGPRTTTFTYDALNRVTLVAYPDTTTVGFTYDANGNRKSMTDSTGVTSYNYDALNRLTSKSDPQGKVVSYTYDGVGNVKTLGYPGGQTVTYNYDAAERLTSLTDWLSKTTTYTLNRTGQVTSALMGNGSRLARQYDASGRLLELNNAGASGYVNGPGGWISSQSLTLDSNGNIIVSNGLLPLLPTLPNVNRAFTYDAANRLATASGAAVTHDQAGRITGLAGNTYTYNDRDQITAVTGTQTASHAYNGQGHRVTSTIGGTTTRYVIDPNRSLPEVLAETDAAGTVLRNYVYGYGLVEQIDAAGTAKYYHFDPTGSTLALTNAAGVVTDSYAYTPYGETTTSGSTVNPFKYVGKLGVMDDGNGMHFMRARYYRADIARFMSLDQVAGSPKNPQTLNRYAYATGNPVMGVDPSGLYGEYLVADQTKTYQEIMELATKWNAIVDRDYANTPVRHHLWSGVIGGVIVLKLIADSSKNVMTNTIGEIGARSAQIQGQSYEAARKDLRSMQKCMGLGYDLATLLLDPPKIITRNPDAGQFVNILDGASNLYASIKFTKDLGTAMVDIGSDADTRSSCSSLLGASTSLLEGRNAKWEDYIFNYRPPVPGRIYHDIRPQPEFGETGNF